MTLDYEVVAEKGRVKSVEMWKCSSSSNRKTDNCLKVMLDVTVAHPIFQMGIKSVFLLTANDGNAYVGVFRE